MTTFKKFVAAVAGTVAVATVVAVTYKGRGKSRRWYLSVPLYAYRLLRHRLFFRPHQDIGAKHGEDHLLAALFPDLRGYCVEVGANDGIDNSNTLLFERRGWTGLLIEADPAVARRCRRNRPAFKTISAAAVAPGSAPTVSFERVLGGSALSTRSFAGEGHYHAAYVRSALRTRRIVVPARTLDSMLEDAAAPRLDFLTVDVEGYEADVLAGFSPMRWCPRVIVLERNGLAPDPRIVAYMDRHGYERFRTTPEGATQECNDWYRQIP